MVAAVAVVKSDLSGQWVWTVFAIAVQTQTFMAKTRQYMAKTILVSVTDDMDRKQLVSMLPKLGIHAYAVNDNDETNLVFADAPIGPEKAQEILYDPDLSEGLASGRVVEVDNAGQARIVP